MDFSTELIHGHYLVSSCSTGAVSLFTPAEYLSFHYIINTREKDRRDILRKVLSEFGCSEEKIVSFTDLFLRKLTKQGWFRNSLNDTDTEKAQVIYFTVTTKCNLSCIYCYIGDERRQSDHWMSVTDAVIILKKIREFNPSARIIVTGGEPLTHPWVFEIFNTLEEYGMKFTLGTNAVLIDQSCAERLKGYKNLTFVQASLDGITPEVHAITRGNTWNETMKGIRNLIEQKVPFSIAPTLHEGNLHEIPNIARFTYSNGGIISPNHLRKFPHAPYVHNISLNPESLRKCIIETFDLVNKKFHHDVQTAEVQDQKCEDLRDSRCRYVCGNAWYTFDIDWNGDVYPCHLLREKDFILGNILSEEFPVILERGKQSKTRLKAYEIPKCKRCPFVSTCAGGCRASAFYTKGTFAAEDEFCDILYKFEIDKLFQSKGLPLQH
jgi:radical SAM protein with 4Fe4S-binding SPASM domain